MNVKGNDRPKSLLSGFNPKFSENLSRKWPRSPLDPLGPISGGVEWMDLGKTGNASAAMCGGACLLVRILAEWVEGEGRISVSSFLRMSGRGGKIGIFYLWEFIRHFLGGMRRKKIF